MTESPIRHSGHRRSSRQAQLHSAPETPSTRGDLHHQTNGQSYGTHGLGILNPTNHRHRLIRLVSQRRHLTVRGDLRGPADHLRRQPCCYQHDHGQGSSRRHTHGLLQRWRARPPLLHRRLRGPYRGLRRRSIAGQPHSPLYHHQDARPGLHLDWWTHHLLLRPRYTPHPRPYLRENLRQGEVLPRETRVDSRLYYVTRRSPCSLYWMGNLHHGSYGG